MSDTTPNSTSDACEQLLDYVYGELDEPRKRAFEEHLAGCSRCQSEAASFGRVRAAVKRVMPAVEPSGNVGGALHAQLMHAAAQRAPRRGVLLSFPRKIMQHPAWAMAAMFTIVGGAVAINWSRGKMAMPVTSEAAPAAASTPAMAQSPVAPEPEAAADKAAADKTAVEGAATAEKAKYKEEAAPARKPLEDDFKLGTIGKGGKAGGGALAKAKDGEAGGDQLLLESPPTGTLTVQRPAAHRAAAAPAKEAAPKTKKVAAVRGAKYDDAFANDATEYGNVSGVLGSRSGAASGAGGAPANSAPAAGSTLGGLGRVAGNDEGVAAKSSAPDSLSRAGKAEAQPQRDSSRGYAAAMPAPPQKQQAWQKNAPTSPPPPPTVAAPSAVTSSTAEREQMVQPQAQGYARNKTSVATPAGPNRETEALRKKADEAAKSNRCDEAIKLYQELDKLSQYVTPTERLNYVRCLSQRGRQEEAQQRLDEIKADKRLTNSEVQKVEAEINSARRPRAEKKAAPPKKPAAAPADRASDLQTERRAEPAPAQEAPHATDTKVKQNAY